MEESEHVVVTVRNERALVPPHLPAVPALRRSPGRSEDMDTRELGHKPEKDGHKRSEQISEASGRGFQEPEPDSLWKPQDMFYEDEEEGQEAPQDGSSRFPSCEMPRARIKTDQQSVHEELKGDK